MKLRPYQEEIKTATYAEWNAGHKNVLLVMPTGMGKTKTFSQIAIDMALDPNGPRLPTAIMVHRKELVSQICLTLAEEGITHNIIAPVGVIKGIVAAERQLLKRQFYDYNAPITVISVDTLNARILKHEKWAKSIKLWITDEAAHVLKNNKWGRAIAFFPNANGLGVTATPRRLDRRGLGRGSDGVFDVMVQGPTTRWGIQNNFLSRYKIAVPASDYREYLGESKGDGDYSKEAMALASAQSHIIGDAVANYIKFANGKQAIYFCTDINAGKKMEAKFREAGIKAKLLTGETPDQERIQALFDFRDKKIQVLLNIDLFDEGLDVPGIEVVGHCRPTKSTGKFLQMCGRGLRVMDGKEFCIIIDHVGNVKEHGLPDETRTWTLDRYSKRRDKINFIRICQNHMCNAPFDRILTECPYCGEVISVGSNSGGGGGRISPKEVDGDLFLIDPDTIREMEAATILEQPVDIAKRVGKAAGGPAGLRAMHNQVERQATQKSLIDAIAKWAGRQRHRGLSDRSIHKLFYLQHDLTMTEALGRPREDMQRTLDNIETYEYD